MTEIFNVDWHFHPGGFFGPEKNNADLQRVVDAAEAMQIQGTALTSCHDLRWDYYRQQATGFPDFESDDSRRIFQLSQNGSLFYFFDGQEVKGSDGDLNIICPGGPLNFAPKHTSVEELASIANSLGAITNLPHAYGLDGIAEKPEGERKARDLIRRGLIKNVEVYDALNTRKGNTRTADWYTQLIRDGVISGINVQPVAVSDGHRDVDLGKAYSTYLLDGVNLGNVFEKLKSAPVQGSYGRPIGWTSTAIYVGAFVLAVTRLRK